jgi:hypothetical protein
MGKTIGIPEDDPRWDFVSKETPLWLPISDSRGRGLRTDRGRILIQDLS